MNTQNTLAYPRSRSRITRWTSRIAAVLVGPALLLGFLNDSLGLGEQMFVTFFALATVFLSTASADFCRYIGSTVGSCGRRFLNLAGGVLAASFGSVGLFLGFGSFLEEVFYSSKISVIELSLRLGEATVALSILGVIIFLLLVLRFVSAELKIAQGWASPDSVYPHAEGGNSGEVMLP